MKPKGRLKFRTRPWIVVEHDNTFNYMCGRKKTVWSLQLRGGYMGWGGAVAPKETAVEKRLLQDIAFSIRSSTVFRLWKP